MATLSANKKNKRRFFHVSKKRLRHQGGIYVAIQAISHNPLTVNLAELFPNADLKIIKLFGYSHLNRETDEKKRYNLAKRPVMRGWNKKPGLNARDINNWLNNQGWIGLLIPKGYIVVDIDNENEGELIFKALLQENYKFHGIKTINGYQFIFKSSGTISVQGVKVLMAGGFLGDYRLDGKGQIVLPSRNTKGRYWIHQSQDHELSEMPIFFNRLKTVKNRPFPIPVGEGIRNDTLYKHCCRLVEFGYKEDQIFYIANFLNKHFFIPPLDDREFNTTVKSALKRTPSGKNYSSHNMNLPPRNTSTGTQSFNLTEIGNAERLVYYHADKIKYCVEYEEWLIWNGKVWQKDIKRQIERIANKTFRQMYIEAANIQEEESRRKLVKWAQASERSSVLLNSIERAKAMVPILQSELNRDNFLFNCKNGVIDLRTGQLLPHNRDYMITNYADIEYNPEAECPTWIKFLQSIMRDDEGNVKHELIDFLQKAIGYALTGDTKEQVVFFLWGNGRNGKSTFINIIREILGDYGKQTNADTFTAKTHEGGINNDIARLSDARFVSAVESEEGQRLSEALIKQLTGGEPITARFLRKEFFEFLPKFKIFFTTNHKPIVKGNDEGIWRRIKLIPFTVTIPKEEIDMELPEKLRKELSGILKWAVEGCLKWQREGLGEPEEVKQATQGYKDEMDILGQFLSDHCVVRAGARVSAKNIYDAYKNWCEENGEYVLSSRKFNRRLEERGFVKKRSGKAGNTYFHGIGLLSFDFTERTEELKQTERISSIPYMKNSYGGIGENASVTFSSSVTSVEYVEEDI